MPKTDTIKPQEHNRIRDLSQENMFSFFLDKQTQWEGQSFMQHGANRLHSLAQGSGINFLFSADPKLQASQSHFLPQLISPTRSYDPFSKPAAIPQFSFRPTQSTVVEQKTKRWVEPANAAQEGKIQEESLRKSQTVHFQRFTKDSAEHLKYKQPSYWEDINNKRRRDAAIQGHGLITPTREEGFLQYMQQHYVSLWSPQPAQVASKQFRKNIDLLLMSVESSLFALDKANGLFFVVNKGMSTDGVSGGLESQQRKP